MTRSEVLTDLRRIINCAPVNGLWDEETLVKLISEGQDEFCERTGFFVDNTNYTITTEADEADYDLDDEIIEVLGVYDSSSGKWLGKTCNDFQNLPQDASFPFVSSSVVSGTAYQWMADAESGLITLVDAPDDVRTLNLRVWRRARNSFIDGYDLELPARFHRAPLEWAAYQCLSDHDAESFDPKEADRHYAKFDEWCLKGKRAFNRLTAQQVHVGRNSTYVV